jgi:hypothetical protein
MSLSKPQNVMRERMATCACGQLKAICFGEPVSISLCHCLECQKRTGSTYGIAAFFASDNVEITGKASCYERNSDNNYKVTFYFCPNCGSTVYWKPERKPDFLAIAVGSFADPKFPKPDQTVYEKHKHHWVEAP